MSADVDSLTDKEKEALRLLLAGHDAKSSANELGVSVHAINDRLRNARRKLDVASSREAARILGSAEGADPQSVAHTSLGMENEPSDPDDAVLNHKRRTGPSRAVWLTGGMLIMSIAIAAAAIVFFAGSPETAETASSNAPTAASPDVSQMADERSLRRAREFLALVDASDWEGSWRSAGRLFQTQVTPSEWTAQIEPVRGPLGDVSSRSLSNVQRTSTVPGEPDGEFQIMQFQTHFENKGRSIETVVMMMGADGWEVAGYFIA